MNPSPGTTSPTIAPCLACSAHGPMRLIGRPFWTVERGAGVWIQKFRDSAGRERKLRVPRKVAPTKRSALAATAWVATRIDESGKAIYTITQLAARMLTLWKGDDRVAPKTWEDREGHLRLHLLPALGSKRPEDLSIPVMRAWVRAQRKTGASRSALNNRLSTLALLLDDAAAEGLTKTDGAVARHAAVRRELPAAPVVAPRVLSPEGCAALLEAPSTPLVWAVRYGLAALAGFEDGVIAGLTWEDHEDGAISVCRAVAQKGPTGWASISRTKNAHRGSDAAPRHVPVHRALAALLDAWRSGGFRAWTGRDPRPGDFVLPQPNGRPWRPASAEKLRAHLDAAGVAYPEGLTFHDLRGSFLTWLAALGIGEEQRKRLAGHAGGVQAEHYLGREALLQADRAAVEKIPISPAMLHRIVKDAA